MFFLKKDSPLFSLKLGGDRSLDPGEAKSFLLNTPPAKQSDVDNYRSHAIAWLVSAYVKQTRHIMSMNRAMENNDKLEIYEFQNFISTLENIILDITQIKINFFDSFYDRYDVIDNIMQATLIPVVKILAATLLILATIVALGLYLFVKSKSLIDNKTLDLENFSWYDLDLTSAVEICEVPSRLIPHFTLSALTLIATAGIDLFNGVAGLLIRPIITSISGYQIPENDSPEKIAYRFALGV